MSPAIDIPKAQIAAFCACNRICRLAFFGSVLRPDFGPDSDIDVLLEFEPNTPMGYLGLSRYFRDEVLSNSYVVYGPS